MPVIRLVLLLMLSLGFFPELVAQRLNSYDRQGKKHGPWKDSVQNAPYDYWIREGAYEHGQKNGEWTETHKTLYGRGVLKGAYANGKKNGWWASFHRDTLLTEKQRYRNDTMLEQLIYTAAYYRESKPLRQARMVHYHNYVCPTGDTVFADVYYCGIPSDSGKLLQRTYWTGYEKQRMPAYLSRVPGTLRMRIETFYDSGRLRESLDSIYLENRVVMNEYAPNGKLHKSETVTGPFGFRYNEWWGDMNSPGYYFFEDGKRIHMELPDSLHPVVREGFEYEDYDSTLSCRWTEIQVGYHYTHLQICMSAGRIRSTYAWNQDVQAQTWLTRQVSYYPSGRLQFCRSGADDTTFYENGKIARIDRNYEDGWSQHEYYPDGKPKVVFISRKDEWRRDRYDAEGNRLEY